MIRQWIDSKTVLHLPSVISSSIVPFTCEKHHCMSLPATTDKTSHYITIYIQYYTTIYITIGYSVIHIMLQFFCKDTNQNVWQGSGYEEKLKQTITVCPTEMHMAGLVTGISFII